LMIQSKRLVIEGAERRGDVSARFGA
jgi:hypothetical protein